MPVPISRLIHATNPGVRRWVSTETKCVFNVPTDLLTSASNASAKKKDEIQKKQSTSGNDLIQSLFGPEIVFAEVKLTFLSLKHGNMSG